MLLSKYFNFKLNTRKSTYKNISLSVKIQTTYTA